MEKENKKLKITANKKVVTFCLIALALLMLVSTSYAYFTATITGNETAKKTTVTTATMGLKLTGNTQVGMSSAMPGESTTITFSVKNTGSDTTTYALIMDQVTNNFADKNDLVYTITSTNNGGSKTETIMPSANGTLIPLISIEPNVTQEYTMTITFKETNDVQNDNQGKTFTGRVQINNVESDTLATRILTDNTVKTNPVWGEASTDKGVYKLSGDKTIDGNPTYYYRGNVENNYVKFGTNGYWPIFYTTSKEVSDNIYSCFNNPDATIEDKNNCVYNNSDATMITPLGADLIWRIVRIAEDGSIRLILDTNETQLFIFQHNGAWGLGENFGNYTVQYYNSVDDSHTPISLELSDFIDGLAPADRSKLYSSKICNTGLRTANNINIVEETNPKYIERMPDAIDTHSCIDEEKIDVSVSMITAPEIYYASTNGFNSTIKANNKSYFNSFADINISEGFLTMSTGSDGGYEYTNNYLDGIGTYVENGYTLYFDNNNTYFHDIDYIDTNYDGGLYIGIRPVINLNPNVKVLNSGNGTKDNPYVIE